MTRVNITFFCKNCDFEGELPAFLDKTFDGKEFFVAKCNSCGSRVVRLVTDRVSDPYYRLSPLMRKQRAIYRKDLIQPGEPGFKMLYPKEWEKLEKAKEEYDNKKRREAEERNRLYALTKHDINKRQAVEKTFAAEEQMTYG